LRPPLGEAGLHGFSVDFPAIRGKERELPAGLFQALLEVLPLRCGEPDCGSDGGAAFDRYEGRLALRAN
jgi:hypothetical protein